MHYKMRTPTSGYIAKEIAVQGKPLEIYTFQLPNDGSIWRYTSYDTDITYDGESYESVPISRGRVTYDTQLNTTTLSIMVDRLSDPILDFLVNSPIELIEVEVSKLFSDYLTDGIVVFKGYVTSVRFSGSSAEIECSGLQLFFDQTIPVLKYQTMCNHTLFDSKCGVSSASYSVTTTVINVDADLRTFTVNSMGPATASYFYTWGFVVRGAVKRMIIEDLFESNRITLRHRIADLTVGDAVTLYAGCDRIVSTCANKFNNLPNYGGFPYIPLHNPTTLTTSVVQETSGGGKK